MTASESQPTSMPVRMLQNLVLWLVAVPALIWLFAPVGETPRPDALGWQRIAMVGLPFLLVSALVEALSERAGSIGRRAYGKGLSTAMVMFVIFSSDRIAAGTDVARFAKGVAIIPIMALFFAVPQWTHEKYFTPQSAK